MPFSTSIPNIRALFLECPLVIPIIYAIAMFGKIAERLAQAAFYAPHAPRYNIPEVTIAIITSFIETGLPEMLTAPFSAAEGLLLFLCFFFNAMDLFNILRAIMPTIVIHFTPSKLVASILLLPATRYLNLIYLILPCGKIRCLISMFMRC